MYFIRIIFKMKFVYNFYILVIVLRAVWVTQGTADFDLEELKHLSRKLIPIECVKLIEGLYLQTSSRGGVVGFHQNIPRIFSRRDLVEDWSTRDGCLVKLEEWNYKYPGTRNPKARALMETTLRSLGRPDLANYIRRNQRVVKFENCIVNDAESSTLSGDIHRISKRHATKATKIMATIKKKKLVTKGRKESKTPMQESIRVELHKEKLAAAIDGGEQTETVSTDTGKETRWIAFIVLLGIIVVSIFGMIVYAVIKKSRLKGCSNREIRTTICTDCCQQPNCSFRKSSSGEVDVEGGKTARSSKCNRFYSKFGFEKHKQQYNSCNQETPPLVSVRNNKKKKKHGSSKRVKTAIDKNCKTQERNRTELKCRKSRKKTFKDSSPLSQDTRAAVYPKNGQSDLKRFQNKLAYILRKDHNNCKCCKCTFLGDGKAKLCKTKFLGKKNLCNDHRCKKQQIQSITGLCISEATNNYRNVGKESKLRKSPKKRETNRKSSRSSSTSSERKVIRGKCNQVKGEPIIVPCIKRTCISRKSSKDRKRNKNMIDVCVNPGTKMKYRKFF